MQAIRYHDKFITQMVTDEESFNYLVQRIKPEYLGTYTRMFTYILDHRSKYGELPPVEQLKTEFDDFDAEYRVVNLQFLVDKLVELHKEKEVQHASAELFQEAVKTNMTTALNKYISRLSKLNQINSTDPTLSMKSQKIEEFVASSQKSSVVCKWGIPTLDRLLGGVYSTDFNILVARPKVGKTHISRWLAAEWWRQGLTPMVITLENGREVTLRSIYGYIGGLSQGMAYRDPTPQEEVEFTRIQAMIDKAPNDLYIIDTLPQPTVDAIFQLVDRYRPDVVIIDQLTLLTVPGSKNADWQTKTEISRSIKNFCQNRKIPVFALTQASRAADNEAGGLAKATQIGYTDAYLQDADTLFSLGKDPTKIGQRYLQITEGRRCEERPTLDMFWDLNNSLIQENREVLLEVGGL